MLMLYSCTLSYHDSVRDNDSNRRSYKTNSHRISALSEIIRLRNKYSTRTFCKNLRAKNKKVIEDDAKRGCDNQDQCWNEDQILNLQPSAT